MKLFSYLFLILLSTTFFAQNNQCLEVKDIVVVGNSATSQDAIITLSGLKIGSCIGSPSPKVQKAVKRLWDEGVFDAVSVKREVEGNKVILVIRITEYQLMGSYSFVGLNGSEEKKVREFIKLKEISRYSPNSLKEIDYCIHEILNNKGYRNASVDYVAKTDSIKKVNLRYSVNKADRIKISSVNLIGETKESKNAFIKALANLEIESPFKVGKFYTQTRVQLNNDIKTVFKNKGYLDIEIDSLKENVDSKGVSFDVYFNEGVNYKLLSVDFEGNRVFSDSELRKITNELEGKSYSKPLLESKLFFEEKRHDVTSLYLDNGYANLKLNFEERIKDDSLVEVTVSIQENELYEFGTIDFNGNIRTKDKVLHQTVLTATGELFSRSKIIMSQTRLQQLDYFVPEKFDVTLNIDTIRKQVDVTYILKEKISDRFLVSGGFDGTYLVGTLGFDFKNFELSDVFRKGARWNPLPAGGGQHLSLKAQSDAQNYYGLSFLFEEPRLKNKPIGIGVSTDYAYYNDEDGGNLKLFSSQIGVSHFPFNKKPFWRLSHQINYQNYRPENYSLFGFTDGKFNAVTYKASLINQTTNNSYFPTVGRFLKLEGSSTLPYSMFKDINTAATNQENYKWLEYYKLKASFKHYYSIGKKKSTVIASKFGVGVLGRFSNQLNVVPFERFEMGGTGITNYSINANDIIGLRGYEVGSLSNDGGDPLALKMSVELRQKLFSFEKWMLTGHVFYENGNTFDWGENVLLNHSTGVGARLFIPMLGVVGVDCGWGLSKQNFNWNQPTVQFTIGLDVGDF